MEFSRAWWWRRAALKGRAWWQRRAKFKGKTEWRLVEVGGGGELNLRVELSGRIELGGGGELNLRVELSGV